MTSTVEPRGAHGVTQWQGPAGSPAGTLGDLIERRSGSLARPRHVAHHDRQAVHGPPRIRLAPLGASGGVGTFAVQLAKAVGAQVTGVCSTARMDLVRSLGADHVIDQTAEDFADGTRRYDLIIDIAGNLHTTSSASPTSSSPVR